MADEGFDSDDFRALREQRREKHWRMHTTNTAAIIASGLPHKIVNGGESVLFRISGKPYVDFYPSTGRWRVPGQSNTYRGGAAAILKVVRGSQTMSKTRPYIVIEKTPTGDKVRFIETVSEARALAHVTAPRFEARVATREDIIKHRSVEIEVVA